MATALQICNSALIKLGAKSITALSGTTTKETELCVAQYPRVRNNLLKSHVWLFSRVLTDALTSTASDVANVWSYYYTLPTTCGRVLSVTTTDDIPVDYEIIGRKLYTHDDTVRLRYCRTYTEVDDGADFPDDFADVLANALAVELCVALTQNPSLKREYEQMFYVSLSQARFNGAVELPAKRGAAEDWIEAHAGYTSSLADPDHRGLTGY